MMPMVMLMIKTMIKLDNTTGAPVVITVDYISGSGSKFFRLTLSPSIQCVTLTC